MQIRQADKHMKTSLWGISKKARADARYRFGNLYSLLNEANLRWCFSQLNRKSAEGIDKVSWDDFEANLSECVSKIVTALKEKRYKAMPVRRCYIPKPGGKQRPLGIPTIGDKVVQAGAARILSAIFEEDFLSCSHGYRQGKSARQAALELSQRLQRGKFGWVFDADIKGFFDNLNHDWLIRMLELRINDKAFLRLIRKWLKAGIMEKNERIYIPSSGTPQGGIISAVLANIYLHFVLDIWFERVIKPQCKGEVMLIRYADDFVCCFQYYQDLQKFSRNIESRLEKFNLNLAKDKTRQIKFTRFETRKSNGFTFLGFEYHWGLSRKNKPLIKMQTAKEKLRRALLMIKIWVKKVSRKVKITEIMKEFHLKLLGHYNYYGVSGNGKKLLTFYNCACDILFKWLNRRSQRKSYNWKGFHVILKYYKTPLPRITGYWN